MTPMLPKKKPMVPANKKPAKPAAKKPMFQKISDQMMAGGSQSGC